MQPPPAAGSASILLRRRPGAWRRKPGRYAAALLACLLGAISAGAAADKPNLILIFADDLGYGDLGCFGSPNIQTPHLDRMAAEGMKLTSFYAQPSCTPSRAALLTGRLPLRSGMYRVVFPEEDVGLPTSELTMAEALKEQGYRTAAIGKWHLGHTRKEFRPLAHGFDEYYGLLYSNDMIPPWVPTEIPLRLMRNEEYLDGPVDQTALTEDYTGEAIRWIQRWKGSPFFIYLAHTMPHKPLYASKRFLNTSRRGLYGDVIAELDWNVGRILQTLKTEGLDKDTLIIFTSDNGPWLSLKQHGGSAGPLRGSKGSTYEGGVRVPFIARWPGRIPAGRASSDIASIMDLLPTSVALAGGKLPVKVQLDGVDVSSLLLEGKSRHAARRIFYYRGPDLEAVREGDWKVRLDARDPAAKLELFNLELDVSEAFNLADAFPEKAAKLKELLDKERKEMIPGPAYKSLIESREKLQSIYQPRGGVKLMVPEPAVR